MQISSLKPKIPVTELSPIRKSSLKITSDSNISGNFGFTENFGPLSQKPNKEKLTSFTENFMKNEKQINSWIKKLTAGHIPSTSEVIEIQSLLFTHMQKTELLTKLSDSLINSLKRLERMQL